MIKKYYEDVKSGYAVASDEDKVAMSTFAHEFGHLINFIITHDVSGYTINYDMIAKEYRDDTLKAYRKETKEKGKIFMKKVDKRIFKKSSEELQQYMMFKRRGSKVEAKKGKGSYSRKKKHKNDEYQDYA